MELAIFNIYGVGAIALTVLLTGIVGKFVNIRWLPLVALGLGIVIVSLATWDIGLQYILTGLVVGGLAMGGFDVVKKTVLGK